MSALPEAIPPILQLRGFGVAFGERTILSHVDMTIPEVGIVTLLGPAGTGKSTLLRTLAGFNSANPSMRTWGEALYAGYALSEQNQPSLVAQSAKLMVSSILENIISGLPERGNLRPLQQRELAKRLLIKAGLDTLTDRLDEPVIHLSLALQRRIAILREAATSPRLLFIDEPTTGLADDESYPILEFIRAESQHRAVLLVLHNQAQARTLGGIVVLLAGGRVQESAASKSFFETPNSNAGREFVRVGTCSVPSPDARPEDLDPSIEPPTRASDTERPAVSHTYGPRGFLWLKRGKLAGTPRPGIIFDLRYDLDALQRVGVTALVSLTETPMEVDVLSEYGISCLRSPIPDMGAPSMEQARHICESIDQLIAAGETVAVHCRAGLGRTGTILASYLIWEGEPPLKALETVRKIETRWVQSDEQAAFLEEFAHFVADNCK